ncbi:MAG: TetR/AcrR family transcriptional regulator [Xanthobacteraceae bacterium]|nr:TetR/AcrR family transcriptional regulator [Xanthobacteraceae bacterium]MBX3521871.1 TetR/AcrR family transcriptional regulator [Xanthobacteraceae bacterium]MBX3533485.1 TetR/AcrR family transcriptional regulator [Xanthobacteraceae bacterium]MBX3549948.1 TetR/AcrR family transcriptional regulator [Xanthobacteraceae bacterium]MCW5675587.1 TetR/AcrR family transcriptional regulator [Xanthobacteraceae bacterium]
MSRPRPRPQTDRREEILLAAKNCFSRRGFHGASMQEICAEAQMSPGSLYRYFPSKEAIIAGIAEQDRADVAEKFQAIVEAPDFFQALALAARRYIVEESDEEVCLHAEIKAESRRNPEIAKIYEGVEQEVKAGMLNVLRSAVARGDIPPEVDLEIAATMLMALVDGLYWRRAVDPEFDAETVLPTLLSVTHFLLTEPENYKSKSAMAGQPAAGE